MLDIGLFEILLLAGIFLLVLGLGAIGFLTYQRHHNTTKTDSTNSASPAEIGDSSSDSRVVDAENLALKVRTEAEEYATQVRAKAEGQLQAVETARRDSDEETRQRRTELRDQRLEIER